MKLVFETETEYREAWDVAHSGILYWKKRKQDAEGKICMQCDGTPTHYTVEECIENLKKAAGFLKNIEDSTRPVDIWDDECEEVIGQNIVSGPDFGYYSGIISKYLDV